MVSGAHLSAVHATTTTYYLPASHVLHTTYSLPTHSVLLTTHCLLRTLSRFQNDAKMCWLGLGLGLGSGLAWSDFVMMTIDGLISDCVPLETLTTWLGWLGYD